MTAAIPTDDAASGPLVPAFGLCFTCPPRRAAGAAAIPRPDAGTLPAEAPLVPTGLKGRVPMSSLALRLLAGAAFLTLLAGPVSAQDAAKPAETPAAPAAAAPAAPAAGDQAGKPDDPVAATV